MLAGTLDEKLKISDSLAVAFIEDVMRAVRGVNPYNSLNMDAFTNGISYCQEGFSTETAAIFESIKRGASDLDNHITGSDTAELLYGFSGDDTLLGDAGADTLIGGFGNDLLEGGMGSDIYHFVQGFGKDRIRNFDTTEGRGDTILLRGITKADLLFSRSGDDLIIDIQGSNDQLRIESHFYLDAKGGYAVDRILFDDGSVMEIGTTGFPDLHTIVTTITDNSDEIHGTQAADTINALGGDDQLYGKDGADTLYGGAGNDTLSGERGNDSLLGGTGNDRLLGGDGDDLLSGDNGIDYLLGGSGDDTLIGGEGNDFLEGGRGNNVFRYNLGDGSDTILYPKEGNNAVDTLEFGAGINEGDISIRRWSNDLLLFLPDNERVRVENYFLRENSPLQRFRFANGVLWNTEKILSLVRIGTEGADYLYGNSQDDAFHGLGGNDNIRGYGGADLLYGDEGNDTLTADGGADLLEGGAGNDRLYGGDGDDTLTGGADTDILDGGRGNDIYLFSKGFGEDFIYNSDNGKDRVDIIQFGEDIHPEDITAKRSGNNLVLNVGAEDVLTVSNYFYNIDNGGYNSINEICFTDGTRWNTDTMKQLTLHITAGNDEIHGYNEADTLDGKAGDDTLYGADNNDSLYGNSGQDTLYGDAGNDVLYGGQGNDFLHGGAGNDTLNGQEGNDTLTGGGGNDHFIFAKGSGHDRITDRFSSTLTVSFGEGINADTLYARRNGSTLILTVGEEDSLTIDYYFRHGIQRNAGTPYTFIFADGSTISFDDIVKKTLHGSGSADYLFGYEENNALDGGEGNDQIYGNGGEDHLKGGAGNDSLSGGTGSDTLSGGLGRDVLSGEDGNDSLLGGNGNDSLTGGKGDDTLSGGKGDDALTGGQGNDVYLYLESDFGKDRITNLHNPNTSKFDVIRFGAGVAVADITAKRNGQDLLLIADENNQIRVKNYFYDYARGNSIVNEIQFADGTVWDIPYIKEVVQIPTDSNDEIHGYEMDDTLGGEAGADSLYGYIGDDLLIGGHGNDTLDGGDGSDTYLFNLGDGSDVINNHDTSAGHNDVLDFGEGILAENTTLKRIDNNLSIRFKNSSDSVTVTNYFYNEPNYGFQLDAIRFADGTNWDFAYVKEAVLNGSTEDDILHDYITDDRLSGGEGNDRLYANHGNDTLEGGTGSDLLSGGVGADILSGGTGNDRLEGGAGSDALDGGTDRDFLLGGAGDDTLSGGTGDDDLTGGDGSDTYLFNRGDGVDVIHNHDTNSKSTDTLKFGKDIYAEDTILRRDGKNLSIQFKNSSDKITVTNCFHNEPDYGCQLDEIRFADGTRWDFTHVKKAVLMGSTGNDTLYGYITNDRLDGKEGDDTLNGHQGNDTLLGGEGQDSLYGETGDDVLDGGTGDDLLDGGAGANYYIFDKGYGHDTIIDTYQHTLTLFIGTLPLSEIIFRHNGPDLEISFPGNKSDTLTLKDFFGDNEQPRTSVILTDKNGVEQHFSPLQLKELTLVESPVADLIRGYSTDDSISGMAGNDTLMGGDGADSLEGGDGEDLLYGDTGNDILKGGVGNDSLFGGSGNDTLEGGAGYNQLSGGEGDDIYKINGSCCVSRSYLTKSSTSEWSKAFPRLPAL